ncbi:MAG: hypothetical protein GF370_02395 [Candidatus Nealsonbacteria bacterium]|nr:hypothetical protein [Candidatus Nealsonbacteria bacterium]
MRFKNYLPLIVLVSVSLFAPVFRASAQGWSDPCTSNGECTSNVCGPFGGCCDLTRESQAGEACYCAQECMSGKCEPQGPAGVCTGLPNPLAHLDIGEFLNYVIDFIFRLSIIIAPLMIIVGGFLFVTAGGNLEQMSKARQILLWTGIGFAVVLFSKGLFEALKYVLSGS